MNQYKTDLSEYRITAVGRETGGLQAPIRLGVVDHALQRVTFAHASPLSPGEWQMVAQAKPTIVATPGICGGNPRVRGTRVPVWVLERFRRRGDDLAAVLEDFPFLAESDVLAAWDYAEAHPTAIESQRRENEGV
jgi:uncharacterized protein (DUF433 family)